MVPGTPGQPAARVPLPAELEEEAARSATYESYESSSSDSSSSSSEEELPPEPPGRKRKAADDRPSKKAKDSLMVACSIEVTEKDLKRLLKKPKRSAIWLSQKMAEKSKEVSWQRLSQEEKFEFDEARRLS